MYRNTHKDSRNETRQKGREEEGGTIDPGSLVIGKVAPASLDSPVYPLSGMTRSAADRNVILSTVGGGNGVTR